MPKNTLLFLCLIIASVCFSQNDKKENNFFNRFSGELLENIHLHINKTSFYPGEFIWFTAYIQNQITQLPSDGTSNLHVGIYNEVGKEIDKKLLRVENGIAFGDFKIDSSIKKGNYYVMAWTNYMRNFAKLDPFQQKIEIFGDSDNYEYKEDSEVGLMAYPEGGNLINNSFNYIGIQVKRFDKFGNKSPKVRLVDGEGEIVIANISINDEGFGKTGFMVSPNKVYSLQMEKPDGENLIVPINKSLGSNIGLSIDNMGKKQVLVKLVLSKDTLYKKENVTYTLALVQDDFILMQDWKINEDQLAISIDRESIPYGINKAILFGEQLRPIAYRMFFNHYKKKQRIVEIKVDHKLNAASDSLELTFSSTNLEAFKFNLSASILPGETKAFNPKNSLTSSFLIKPFINGNANYNYNLVSFDSSQNYDLDVKLLVEGWGKYDWEDRSKPNSNNNFEFEKGIPIRGRILDADLESENQVLLLTDKSKAMNYEQLQSDKTFSTHMVLYQNDSLAVTLLGKKGVLRKPSLEIQIDSSWQKSNIDILKYLKDSAVSILEKYNEDETLSFKQEKNVIALDEAVVFADEWQDNRLKINSAVIEGRAIGDYEIKRYHSVASYLRRLGFLIGGDRKGQLAVKSKGIPPSIIPVAIIGQGTVDGLALNMPLSRVQTIVHDVRKSAFVSITLRDGHYVSPENRNKYIKQFIHNGYAKPNHYFNPGYEDYESLVFKKYGALFWKANIAVSDKESTTIRVPLKGQERLKVFIEGMGRNGKLISMEKEIDLQLELKN